MDRSEDPGNSRTPETNGCVCGLMHGSHLWASHPSKPSVRPAIDSASQTPQSPPDAREPQPAASRGPSLLPGLRLLTPAHSGAPFPPLCPQQAAGPASALLLRTYVLAGKEGRAIKKSAKKQHAGRQCPGSSSSAGVRRGAGVPEREHMKGLGTPRPGAGGQCWCPAGGSHLYPAE